MQSKFGVRPAPRKRPWLCKASPKALPVPAVPRFVLATLWIKVVPPVPPDQSIARTILLENRPLIGIYFGELIAGPAHIQIVWRWQIPNGQANAEVQTTIPWPISSIVFPLAQVKPYPHLAWYQNADPAPSKTWIARMEITS